MKNQKISVIMPAYNVEKYAAKAIESVQCQSYTNWELIIVDDGSIDNTLQIIKECAANDSRIIFTSQQNQGQAAARNVALDMAVGEFVMFLDSDDAFISPLVFENCIQSMNNNHELTVFNAMYCSQGSQSIFMSDCIYPKHSMEIVVPENKYCGSFSNVWSGCFRRDIIEKINCRFIVEHIPFEDWEFMVYYSTHCRRINYINKPWYAYNYNSAGSINTIGIKAFNIFEVYDSLRKKLIESELWEKYEEITTLKIMLYMQLFYYKMRETINDNKILNDYLLRAHGILQSIPEDIYKKNLALHKNQAFLVLLRKPNFKNNFGFEIKVKVIPRLKRLAFALSCSKI